MGRISDAFSLVWYRYRIQVAVFVLFLALWALFFALNPFAFTRPFTYTSLMSTMPFTIVPALSLTYVIICAEIDLSFPSVMAWASWVLATSWTHFGPNLLGVILALLAGLVAGFLNGLLVTKARIPSMIATLGTLFFWRGVVMVCSQGFGIPLFMYRDALLFKLLVGRIGGFFPAQMIWTIVLAIILWVFLNRHKFGAHVYFTGDNRTAAQMMGINTDKILIGVFMIHGVVSAFAGILATLEVATFWPSLGEAYLMKSIAAVVVGGTSIFGGSGTIFGTFFGGLTLGLIELGLLAAGVAGFWINLVYGVVITVALMIQVLIRETEIKREAREILSKELPSPKS
ncbi:MAG: sugar ABC transporter permease [Thermofilum sp. ex4484_15]|nr:MAG: sugar ABC transporter permease [Thermofilum sp. ex4484_15]